MDELNLPIRCRKTLVIGVLFQFILNKSTVNLFCLGLKIKYLDLETLIENLVALDLSENFSNSVFIVFVKTCKSLCEKNTFVSSANKINSKVSETLHISLIYTV
jgi:hypothetical protein